MKKLISIFLFLTAGLSNHAQEPVIYDGWRVMPIRSEGEFKLGGIGGEGEQHMHGITRCYNHPNVIYIAHDVCQIWRSGDGGDTWDKCLCKGMFVHAALSIEVDPLDSSVVFATVSSSSNFRTSNYEGVFRSKDSGKTWELVLPSKPNYNSSLHRYNRKTIAYDRTSINVDENKAMRWYVVHPYDSRTDGGPGAFYISENGGNSWIKLFDHTEYEKIYDLKTHPVDGTTVYMGTEDGLFCSTDRGKTFSKLGDLPAGEVMSVEINPKNPQIIFATVKADGVYRSTNGGLNFKKVTGNYAYFVFMNPGFPDLLYMVPEARTGANLWVSRNGGNTWTKSGYFEEQPGLSRNYKIVIRGQFSGIAPNPKDSTDAFAYSVAQFRRTSDAGVTFDVSSDFFTGFAWGWGNQSMVFDPYNPDRFVTFNADVGMMLTETGSDFFERRGVPASWREGSNPIIPWTSMYNGDIEPVQSSSKIVSSAGYTFDTKVVFTGDAGVNWSVPTVIESGITTAYKEYHLFVKYHTTDKNIIYAGNKISSDGGSTFTALPMLDDMNGSIFGMCDKYPDIIYAINRNNSRNKIYRSTDRGQNWSLYASPGYSFTPLDSRPTFNVHPVDPNKVFAVCNGNMTGVTRGDMAVFDGTSWKGLGVIDVAGNTQYGNFARFITFDPTFPNIMYVSMFTNGIDNVWRSIDDGKTWMNISYNLPRIGSVGLKVNPHTGELFIGSAAGTWILPPPYKSSNTIYKKNYTRPYYYALPACYTGKIRDQQTNLPADNLIVRIYNAYNQQLIGEGITKDGYYYIPVSTDDTSTAEEEGTSDNSAIIVKILMDNSECQLYTDSLGTQTSIIHESGVNKEINLWMKGSVLGVSRTPEPTKEILFDCYPNPFSSSTTIRYEVLKASKVTLSIYNFLGEEINRLIDEPHQPGIYETRWNGTDQGNANVSGGFYLFRMRSEGSVYQKKVLYIK
ncbi:MAG: T9SS type A sorting domain-containing protein [Mariniphaga sp.]|nr:T9SS type A sorting domain-containing protein [Mariniphaga sp.]